MHFPAGGQHPLSARGVFQDTCADAYRTAWFEKKALEASKTGNSTLPAARDIRPEQSPPYTRASSDAESLSDRFRRCALSFVRCASHKDTDLRQASKPSSRHEQEKVQR